MEHLDFFLVISSEYHDVRYTCLIWEHLHFSPADRGHSAVVTGHLVIHPCLYFLGHLTSPHICTIISIPHLSLHTT